MKKWIVSGVILFSSLSAMATQKSLLECSQKFYHFKVFEDEGSYKMNRGLLLNRVRGNPYVRGTLSATAEGNIEGVVSVKRTDKALTFTLADGKELSFKVSQDQQEEVTKVEIHSTAEGVESKLAELLGTDEYPLEFYGLDSCSVK